MVAFLLRASVYLEAASNLLCRRQVVVPLLVVLVVSLPLVPILPSVCVLSLCLLVILWSSNKTLQRVLGGSVV